MRIEMAARLLLTQSKAQREMIREVFPGTLHYHMSKLDEEGVEIESRWGTMVEVARIICKLDDKGDRCGITKVMACEGDAVLLLK